MPDYGNINEPGARVQFPKQPITQQKAPAARTAEAQQNDNTMPDYIVAKPCSGRPTVLCVFQDYDVAKLVAGEGEIVTNAGFVSRKGNAVPKKFSRIKWPVTRPLFRRVLKNIKRAA